MFEQHSPALFTKLKVRYLILTFFLVNVGATAFLAIIKVDVNNPMSIFPIYIGTMITFCLLILQRCHKLKISSREIIGKLPPNIKWLRLIGLMLAVLGFSVGSALVCFSLLSSINPEFVQKIFSSNQGLKIQPSDLFVKKALSFLTIVIIAPITEEFIFRGIILNRWSEKWNVSTALIASSLFFGCLHIHPIGLSMFGLIMGLLYIQTKTLWIPIACHAFNNLIAFTAMSFSQPKATNSAAYSTKWLQSMQFGWFAGAVILAISLIFLWPFIRQNFPSRQQPASNL
jgi:uncharacterized protein